MLVQSAPAMGPPKQVIAGFSLFVPISEGATEIADLLGCRVRPGR